MAQYCYITKKQTNSDENITSLVVVTTRTDFIFKQQMADGAYRNLSAMLTVIWELGIQYIGAIRSVTQFDTTFVGFLL